MSESNEPIENSSIDDEIRNLGDAHMLAKLVAKCPAGSMRIKRGADSLEKAENVKEKGRLTVKANIFQSEHLNEARRIAADVREQFAKISQPWDDNGYRLVPNVRMQELDDLVNKAKQDGEDAWKKFIADYDNAIERDKQALGDLFNGITYPDVEDLKNIYVIEMVVNAVPSPTEDVRSGWDDESIERYTNKVRGQFQGQLKRAVHGVVTDIEGIVTNVCTQMEEGKIIRDALINNLRSMTNSIRDMNITNDPEITAIHARMVDMLKYSPEELREDQAKRDEVKTIGKEITEVRLPKVSAKVQLPGSGK